MDTVLLPLVRSVNLPEYVRQLNQLMADEAEERKKFRDWLTPGIKAEFINGEVIVHSPARYQHSDAQMLISRLLSMYVDGRNLGKVLGENNLIELDRNDYMPDVCFWRNKKSFHFQREQMVYPPPDLAVEILLPSTEGKDRDEKLREYALNDVQECWLVDPIKWQVEQYVLHNRAYELRGTWDRNEVIRSVIVDDFEAPVLSFFDAAENMAAIGKLVRF